jgi:hypothetical protein
LIAAADFYVPVNSEQKALDPFDSFDKVYPEYIEGQPTPQNTASIKSLH